jgi:hypothetical protein
MKKENKKVETPLAIRAEEALKKAVAEAIAEHRLKGRAIAVWRDGKVTRVPADQIVVREIVTRSLPRDGWQRVDTPPLLIALMHTLQALGLA